MRASLTLVLCLLLLGCSGGTDPEREPSNVSSGAGKPLSSSKGTEQPAPELPPEAASPFMRGAEAFTQHYIDLLNYAANTGETDSLHAAASPECRGCADYAETYAETYEAGGYIETTGWKSVSIDSIRHGRVVTVLTDVTAPNIRYVRESGERERVGRGGKYKLLFELKFRHGGWVVTRFTEQENA